MTERDPQDLKAFQDWFFSPGGPGIGRIPLCEPTHEKDGITAITLYRRKGYQAELIIIPPGQPYEIHIPTALPMSFVFLGGSFDYDAASVPGMGGEKAEKRDVADTYQKEIDHIMQSPDALEQPHPLRLMEKYPPFISLPGGASTTFQATGKTGLMLLLGLYETDSVHTGLEHIRALPQSAPLEKTS